MKRDVIGIRLKLADLRRLGNCMRILPWKELKVMGVNGAAYKR